MILYFIQFIIVALFTLFISIIMHELGHFIYFKHIIGRNVEIRFLQDYDGKYKFKIGHSSKNYNNINKKQLIKMYGSGIIVGMLPIFLASIVNPFLFIVFTPYLVGCVPDLKSIYKVALE